MMERWERERRRGGPGEDEGQEGYAREKVRGGRGKESDRRSWEGERGRRETERNAVQLVDYHRDGTLTIYLNTGKQT
jgi:hypothetical protein